MNSTNQIFKEAIELIRSGELEKASTIIHNCEIKGKTIKYLVNKGWHSDEALQFFHDGILVFLEKIKNGELRNHDNLSGYFFQICKNSSLLGYRITELIKTETKNFEKEFPDITLNSSNDEFGLQNYAKKAFNAFFSLGDKCKEIMKMKYVWDYSHEHIAEKMNYANVAVSRNRLNECLEKLLNKAGQMSAKLSYEDLENLRNSLEKR